MSSVQPSSVNARTTFATAVESFVAAFAGCGLAPKVPTPCYGLAEATLPVTAPPLGEGMVAHHFSRSALALGRAEPLPGSTPDTVRLVSCGVPRPGVSLRIVDPRERRVLPAGAVGEIWVRGPNVADGYWGRPERSAEVFTGRLVPTEAAAADPATAADPAAVGLLGCGGISDAVRPLVVYWS